jgi:hypothetical protein
MAHGSDEPPTTVAPPAAAPRAAVPPRAPVVREPVAPATAGVDPMWLARIEDRIGSLTTAVVILAILSLAALGLAVYALVQSDDAGNGASSARVSRLSDRVSRLEGKSANTADAGTTSSLASQLGDKADSADVRRLRSEVGQLRSAIDQSNGGSESTAKSVSDLNSRLDQLEQQVADLKASSSGGTP